jgi:hypothetical protein
MGWLYCVLEVNILKAMDSVTIVQTELISGRESNVSKILYTDNHIYESEWKKELYIAIADIGWTGYELVSVTNDGTKFYFKKPPESK